MKTNLETKYEENVTSQSYFVGIWRFLAIGCFVLSIGGTILFLFIDSATSINFALNITTEAIGIVATVVFVQRYVDKANQREIEQTNDIIKENLNELKDSLASKNKPETRLGQRKRYHSQANGSQKKKNRLNTRR